MKSLFKKIKEKGMELFLRATTLMTTVSLAITNPVYAQSLVTGDPDTIFKNFIGEVLGLVTYAGVGLLVWGLIAFFLALRNEEAEKKTAAIYNIIAGIGIIGIRAILTAVGVSI